MCAKKRIRARLFLQKMGECLGNNLSSLTKWYLKCIMNENTFSAQFNDPKEAQNP